MHIPRNGHPSHHLTLSTLHRELNTFAMTQKTPLRGGNRIYLALLMTPDKYLALTQVAFDFPVYPGANPINAPGSTAPQITETNSAHLSNLTQYSTYKDTKNMLKTMFLLAAPTTFIQVLEDRLFGYLQVTTLQLLQHLDTIDGEVTIEDLANNLEQINRPRDPSTPIENL